MVPVQVYDQKTESKPTAGAFFLPKNPTLADERTVAFVMRTSLGGYSLGIPYSDTYILRAKSGKAKFCNVSKKTRKVCAPEDLVSELTFTYSDTYRGVLVGRAVPLRTGELSYELVRRSDGLVIAESAVMQVSLPSDIASAKTYRTEVIRALERGLFRTKSGRLLPDWELKGKQAKEIVGNVLGYAYLKSGDNRALKQKFLQIIVKWNEGVGTIGDYETVSRGRFAKLLMDALSDPRDIETSGKKWVDERGNYEAEMRTLRVRDGFAWRDGFGDRYFQPDKTLTIEEALYFADFSLESVLGRAGLQ